MQIIQNIHQSLIFKIVFLFEFRDIQKKKTNRQMFQRSCIVKIPSVYFCSKFSKFIIRKSCLIGKNLEKIPFSFAFYQMLFLKTILLIDILLFWRI